MEMLREDRAIWSSLELRQGEMPWKSEMGCCGEARGLKQQFAHLKAMRTWAALVDTSASRGTAHIPGAPKASPVLEQTTNQGNSVFATEQQARKTLHDLPKVHNTLLERPQNPKCCCCVQNTCNYRGPACQSGEVCGSAKMGGKICIVRLQKHQFP